MAAPAMQECLNEKEPDSGSLQLPPGSENPETCGNPVSKGKANEPKDGHDNHNTNFRAGCNTMRGAAGTRRGCQDSVSQHGSAGPIHDGPRHGGRSGPKRRPRL